MPRPSLIPALILAAALASAAGLRAASVAVQGAAPGAVSETAAQRLGEDPVEEHTAAQYRSGYFYALACLAGMGGDHQDEAALLGKALEVDPGSTLLMQERGESLVALGRSSEALPLFKKALAADPGDLQLRRRLSRLYQESDRLDEARALFLKPGGADPEDPEWLRALIGLDFAQEDFNSAERRLRSLLAKGGGVDDRELLALSLQRRQRFGEAITEYRGVVASDETRSSTWARLAACEEAVGDTLASKTDLQSGLKATPDSPLLADQLGRLLYSLDDFSGAEGAFDRLVQMDPSDTHSLLYRGLSRLKTKRYAEAEADFTALGAMQKDDPDQGYALALAQMMQKKYPEAEAQLQRVLKLNPQAEAAWAQLAFVDERQKRTAKAVETLKQGLKILPKSEELALLLSAAQEDLKDLEGAEQTLRDAMGKGGGDEVRFQLAVILDKRGKFPDAEKELLGLIASSPKHAQALNYLGYSWADKGVKLPDAEALIRRALAVEPGNRFYLDSLGWALYKQGRSKEALDPLQQASKGLGKDEDADEAVVFDHLSAVQTELGQLSAAKESQARAEEIRSRAGARGAGGQEDNDPAKEPGL